MKLVFKRLLLFCLVALLGSGCRLDSSSQEKRQAPRLKLEIADVNQSDDKTEIFVTLRYLVGEGQILFDSYPNHHRYEISVNGAAFQDVGKGYYVHGPFKKSYIKTITTKKPYDMKPPVSYKIGNMKIDKTDSVRIKMTYAQKGSIDAEVWTGELLSQEYTLKDKIPNKAIDSDKK